MSGQAYEQLTLFQGDSPVSHSVWLESKKAKGMTVTCGLKCSELSESCARIASSVRTYLESSSLPPGRWSRIWSAQAITLSCLILKLRLSALGTEEAGCSLWATPNTMDGMDCRSYEAMKAQAQHGGQRGQHGRNESQEFAHGCQWAVEPDVGRVANGIPDRVDRLKCLGNAVVPQQAYPIFKSLMEELEHEFV